MFLYLVGKLAIVAVYYLARLVPVVGLKLSDRYEHRMFGPLIDDVSVSELRAKQSGGSGRSVTIEFEFDNDSSLDAHIVGGNVRLGHEQDGATVCNLVWTDDFESPPKNVEPSKIEGDGAGHLELERRLGGDELWVDGQLRLRRIVTVRGRGLPLGMANFYLPEKSVEIESSETDRRTAVDG
ncbi:hypothetical protein [Haladaptatus sp. NG-SE-30]